MDNNNIANRIVELRNKQGLSQKQLGDMLGVSNKAVSKWENGESMPKTSTMLKLAEIFEIDVNELIGFSSSASAESNKNEEEINRLKSENAILSSKLNEIDKKKKRGFISVVLVCIVGIIASIVIAFCSNVDKGVNLEIKDAGEKGTSIAFSDETFAPSSALENYILSNYDDELSFGDSKYAIYKDKDGKEHKVIIICDQDSNYIKLTVGKKGYYYSSVSSADLINRKNIYSLTFIDKSITDNYYDDYYYDMSEGKESINCFCSFYKSLGKPIDKAITQSFMGNDAVTVSIELYSFSFSDIEIGEFFKDNKGNTYFYDYVTANAYSVGKEMSDYVYQH